ncbi:MAG TPA: SPOR domain-containing protein [Acidobacteriaceae bacterium]|nr:SPOR domain-containing protein [Acidobacteriaceae bacterium]
MTQRLFDDEGSPPSRGYTRDPDRSDSGAEREISLGAPAILGIFFALALVCACFFGFGYTMGRKSAQAATTDSTAASADASSNGSAKPAAGSLASQPDVPPPQPMADNSVAPSVQPEAAPAAPTPPPATQKNAATAADGMIVGDKPPTSNQQPAPGNQQPATSPGGTIMVQIAAVSSQDVADILTSSLQKKGYSVSVHHEPQDKLLHVQIGPFANRQEAVAMQQRVLADGFNAIVK